MEFESHMFRFFLYHFLFCRVPHSTGLNLSFEYIKVTKHRFLTNNTRTGHRKQRLLCFGNRV